MSENEKNLKLQIARLRYRFGNWETNFPDMKSHVEAYPSNGSFRLLAWMYAAGEMFDEADALLRQASNQDDDFGQSFYARGMIALGRHDDARARDLFITAIEKSNNHPDIKTRFIDKIQNPQWNRYSVPYLLDQIGAAPFDLGFEAFVVPRAIVEEDKQFYFRLMERACPSMGDKRELIKDMLEHDKRLNGESCWYHIYNGHYAWLEEDRKSADYHYKLAKSAALVDRFDVAHFNCGIFSWSSIQEIENWRTQPKSDRFGVNQWVTIKSYNEDSADDLIVLLGCDENYFKYLPKFIFSLITSDIRKANRNVRLHLGLANPNASQIIFLKKICEWLSLADLNVRLVVRFGLLEPKTAALYTCIRYLILPDLLNSNRADVLVLDIDNLIPMDFCDRLADLPSCDIGLREHDFDDAGHQLRGEPWSAINANQVLIRDGEIGRQFAKVVNDIITCSYDGSAPSNWTIDQSAIGQARREIKQSHPAVNFLNLLNHRALTVMPHEVGGKEALLSMGGSIDIDNFFTAVEQLDRRFIE